MEMRLKSLELVGFKSFAKKITFLFDAPITAIVGPNGSGKSNVAEAARWVLGEKSLKSLRGRRGDDLIFHGGGGMAKMNRAAATLVFDNKDRKLNIDYDEISLSREVFRDGANNYYLNGSPVLLRDILEFLSSASPGLSGQFVIGQGEVDHIIYLNSKERRAFIEDALGLRFHQWKIESSEKKLGETKKNMEQAVTLRREITPHLRFLKKQVDKIGQAEKWREELRSCYPEYLKREESYLTENRVALERHRRGPREELERLKGKLSQIKEKPTGREKLPVLEGQLSEVQKALLRLEVEIAEVTRALGRLEGMLEFKMQRETSSETPFVFAEIKRFIAVLQEKLAAIEALGNLPAVKAALKALKELVSGFIADRSGTQKDGRRDETPRLLPAKARMEKELRELKAKEAQTRTRRDRFLREIEEEKQSAANLEHELLGWRAREKELGAVLDSLSQQEEKLRIESENFSREINEGKLLVGEEVMAYRSFSIRQDASAEPRYHQEERRRRIEKLKIRLEDLGVESGGTLKEYEEIRGRDEFLSRELDDLEKSAASLQQIIKELRQKIDRDFKEGLAQINRHFQEFFSLMFGGGAARLVLERVKKTVLEEPAAEDELETVESEEGISIQVDMPRKKIRGLEMLSGGERALVSIAFLFAVSQVNPPPFLVLDETDAALDESNSRRYGGIIENLARHSQLILITHNRETMSHAGILYGVTMGRAGASRLLSIRFDEAVAYAE